MNSHTTSLQCADVAIDRPVSSGRISTLTSAIEQMLKPVISRWRTYHQNRINRRAFQSLLKLEDNILQDIGVTRYDVLWANQLPMSKNAAKELNKIYKSRKKVESRH